MVDGGGQTIETDVPMAKSDVNGSIGRIGDHVVERAEEGPDAGIGKGFVVKPPGALTSV